jgi:hypothetical protein
MSSLLLPRSRRNQVFMVLQSAGLDPYIARFKWVEKDSNSLDDKISVLTLKDSWQEYFFRFDGEGDDYELDFFPDGALGHTEDLQATWSDTVKHVTTWAKAIAGEVAIPDYWESPASVAARVFGDDYAKAGGDQRFSEEEVEHIRRSAREYSRQLAAQHQLSESQQREIDRKLDYLVAEAENQTRSAWLHTSIGIVVAIAATIRPEAGVFAGAMALFGSLFASQRRALPRGSK